MRGGDAGQFRWRCGWSWWQPSCGNIVMSRDENVQRDASRCLDGWGRSLVLEHITREKMPQLAHIGDDEIVRRRQQYGPHAYL